MSGISHLEARASLSLRQCAQKYPDRLAIACGEEKFSSLEFDQMVSAFALRLSRLPKQETFLPMILGADIGSVIAYLAALRSRTPIAFIDSNIGAKPLSQVMKRLRNPTHAVIAKQESSALIDADISITLVGRDQISDFKSPNADLQSSASVLFTSGSTGEPKGVVWDWEIFDSMWQNIHDFFTPQGEDIRLGSFASLGFTSGVYQSLGATLGIEFHLFNAKSSPEKIISQVNKSRITNLEISPTFAEFLHDNRAQSSLFESVNEIITYGEGLQWKQVDKIRAITGNRSRIVTTYGASEAPLAQVRNRIEVSDAILVGKVPIGDLKNAPNLDLLAFEPDSDLSEIVISNHIAQKYFENESLTAQKFYLDSHGVRWYRSGDIATKNLDGIITHAGRVDDLVKINGRLIDPSESEAAIRAMSGVQKVVVLPWADTQGKVSLVAHIVLEPESLVQPSEIYSYLTKNISSHLMPSKLVEHQEIPMTVNGKIDRKFLLSKDWPRWRESGPTESLDPYERFVLEQLRVLLHKADLSLNEDIFGAGMDSLNAVELEVIADNSGFPGLSEPIFLEHRTAGAIAKYLASYAKTTDDSVIHVNQNGKNPPIFIFPGAGATSMQYREFSESMGLNQPLIFISHIGLQAQRKGDESIEVMAQSAKEQISQIYPEGQLYFLSHSAGSQVAIAAGILLASENRKVKVVSLDAVWIANRLSMSARQIYIQSLTRRLAKILKITPRSIQKSLAWRLQARKSENVHKYFGDIAQVLNDHVFSESPTFPIHMLYCDEKQQFKYWKQLPFLSYEQIEGNHVSLLERQYLPELIVKINRFFSIENSSLVSNKPRN